uniref:non-specific serine/threonine protein kinase n=1 Tax=Pohlia nutans TaxID=140635 RepID=A0A1P8DYX9_9BRYO|nr:leucine-rich repeat receptor-like protein kinase [Pohlia nutans]
MLLARAVVFPFLLALQVIASNAVTPDGQALLEFKSGIADVDAVVIGDWNELDATPCNWTGITCTAESFVRTINLTSQGLEGEISSSLGRLQYLEELYLSVNYFQGNIPRELGNCTSLVVLYLDHNLLSGTIPADLGNLKALGDLYLAFNKLEGEIPSSLAASPSIYIFDVGTNRLSGRIPHELFENPKLTGLYINDNNFTGDITTDLEALSKLPSITDVWMQFNYFSGTLPPSLGNATSLKRILLNYQSLGTNSSFGGTIPKEIGKLKNLEIFDIRDNNFTGSLPPELGALSSLQFLFLSTNKLTGSIPREFGMLRNMTLLHLYHNEISGPIPAELGDCELLEEIILYVNRLNGTIPSSLGKLTRLKIFEVYNNSLTGSIPSEIFNCTSLQSFYLSQNSFTGTISPQIGRLKELLSFRISENQLSGALPEEIGELTSLVEIVLSSNRFTGLIPAGLSNMTALQEIFFFDNHMTGPLPPDIGVLMSSLTVFDIRNNSFNGTLPSGLCTGGKLEFLDILDNRFEGAIPSSLATCRSLKRFRAGYNRFTSLPAGFGNNTGLNWIELSSNQLAGPLPPGIGINSNLSKLALDDNKLSGDLSPLVFSKLPNLEFLNLSSNNFTGEIPVTISSCKRLFVLDLSLNSLRGALPAELGNLSDLFELRLTGNKLIGMDPSIFFELVKLTKLNLAHNSFRGAIPGEIGALSTLQYLNLSYGGFSGPIPESISKLDQLEVLDLSNNDLSGGIPSELGDILSLLTVNISDNRLTGPLPPSWVKLFLRTPSAFAGNPGLCVQYSDDEKCVTLSPYRSSRQRNDDLQLGPMMAIILGSALFLLVIGIVGWRFLPGRRHVPLVWQSNVEVTSAPGNTISFDEIMEATQNLSDNCIIGKGGHGTVYKAILASGSPIVVKKIVSLDRNTHIHKSFLTEIETIGNAKHRNLVKLLGFCKWGEVGLLMYDFVPNGDLHDVLHNKERGMVLDWATRLRIAEGVAHGLSYLHHDYMPPIVHRDIKASNVLLDEDLEPHISDFGVAKVMAMKPKDKTMLSTAIVTGTYGYLAPEYGFGTTVTPKVDVYSYGVLLLELLTGKQAVEPSFGDYMHIVAWVRARVQQSGSLSQKTVGANVGDDVIDPKLLHTTNNDQKVHMLRVLRIAMRCAREAPADRPTMREVVEMLRTSRHASM